VNTLNVARQKLSRSLNYRKILVVRGFFMANIEEKLMVFQEYQEVKDMLETIGTEESLSIKKDLEEDSVLTGGDWARFGVIVGLLWNKLDSIITELKSGNMDRKELTRKLSDIADATRNMQRS